MLEQLNTSLGVIVVSILIGLGLAGLFRQVCQGPSCEITKGPKGEDVNGTSFRIGDKCYMYEAEVIECEEQ